MRGLGALGIGIALAVLVIVAVIDSRTIDGLVATSRWVEHTHRVLEKISDVGASVGAARRARRAFLVTGEVDSVAEYATEVATARARVHELRELVTDNPAQTARARDLEAAVAARIALMDADVAAKKAGVSLLADPAAMQRSSDAGGRVDDIVAEMLRDERRLLRERESGTPPAPSTPPPEAWLLREREGASDARIATTRRLLGLGTAVGFAILIGAFVGLRHENLRRQASEAELRRRTESLRGANAFLDSVIENLPAMLVIKDVKELRFVRVNRAVERFFGLARADLVGKSAFELFPAEQAELFEATDRSALDANALVDLAEEPIATEQGQRWLHTIRVPIVDEHGTPAFLLGISGDITDEKRAAEELRHAKDAAEAANRELESFSYSVAHDLRAPLRSIDGFSEALLEDCADKLDAEGVAYLRRVRGATKRMAELIDDLLALSQVTRSDFERDRVDVGAMARAIVAQLRAAAPERDVAVDISDGLVADADPRLLRIALENLIGNAWKFSAKKPSAHIALGAEGGAFYVRDDGAGFDVAYASKLFGVFQRLHAVSEFDGTGIGLATVQRIVQRHGGRIWAEGEVDAGATFFFTLKPSESTT
jgi:PAS domain S-box-containing protein